MNTWIRFIEKWLNESQIAFTNYEFDIIKQELLVGFDELTEDFDRALMMIQMRWKFQSHI
jgi:hypothetical protein